MKHIGWGLCETGQTQAGKQVYFVLYQQLSHKLSCAMLGAIPVVITIILIGALVVYLLRCGHSCPQQTLWVLS